MTEVTAFPWGMVFSNFVWILGLAIILTAFGYHANLSSSEKVQMIRLLKRNSFKKPFFLGLILVVAGAGGSIHRPFLAASLAIIAFLLAIWSFKKFMWND